MKKGLVVSVVSIAVLFGVLMVAPSVITGTLVEFEGGIGVDPVSRAGGIPQGNDVRGVQPGAFPWVIREFEAEVEDNGNIEVEGKGLVLAGAKGSGTRGRVRTVQATLFCGDPASATEHSSGAIILEPNGDFKIKDTLDNLPLPDPCARPVLLIRVVELAEPEELPPAKAWIAAGIPEDDDDDKDKDDD